MTPNLCNPMNFKAPDVEAMQPLMAAQSKLAGLFADHAGRQLSAMGQMSAELFAAGVRIATASAEPGKLEVVLKEVSADLSASVKAQAEAMSAGAQSLQEGLMATLNEAAPKV